MTTAENIVKIILNPILEKDNAFRSNSVPVDFWEKFAKALPDYVLDSKPLYALIYSLELDDPENVISKIPVISNSFIKELAKDYVLNGNSEIALHLIQNHNKAFEDEVSFLQTFQKVIKKVERKRIKEDLPQAHDRLSFELSENEMALVAKKKGREDLKAKMKAWDVELVEESNGTPVITMPTHEEKAIAPVVSKVISLYWKKYASIAAIFIIGFMIWQPTKVSNNKLFSQYNSEGSIIQSIDYQKITTISTSDDMRGGEILLLNYTKSETFEAMYAVELFKNRSFEKSKKMLIALKPKEKNNQLLLFLAIAQLKTNEVNQAVSNLEYLNTIANYEFDDEVKFQLALGYINQNEKKKAKDLLVTLVTNDSKYSKLSQEILDKMRWF